MKKGILAISPLILFLVMYLVGSLVLDDFYKVPLIISFAVSSIYAVAISRKIPFEERIEIFNRGAGQSNIILMIAIFVLAGAFANTAKGMGCVEETVNLTLLLLPANMILAGLFLASCFVSMSIGTSVGTIAALTPIALGIANATGSDVAMITAIIVGGSFFGDNLSFISDTTVAATQSQNCRMKDKFLENIRIVAPAALLTMLIYIYKGIGVANNLQIDGIDFIKIIPYFMVIILSILGVHVLKVLTLGVVLSGVIGIFNGSYDLFSLFESINKGIFAMDELIIVTLIAGGLLTLIKENGGIDFIISVILSKVKKAKGAEFSIGILVALVNVCTANNTVAILTVGSIANNIAKQFNVSGRRAASLLDTFSCMTQGLLPYGAQILIASGLAAISPVSIISNLYYPVLLGIVTIISIIIHANKSTK